MIDLAAVRAIDFHTHAEEPCGCHADDGYDDLQSAMARYFRAPWAHPPTIDQTAAHYRAQAIAAVIFPVDAERETGYRRYANEEVAEACARHADILIPFASIDPARGRMGAREARRLIEGHGIRGFKFHPTMQGFFPDDRMAWPLYEVIAEAGLPALFHTGQTGVGAGMRGGNGMRLKYSNPLHLDDVAVDFPDMPIVMAHPSFPWQDEALAIATHKPNVWIDLSGWRPKYFPPNLIRYADSLLRDRVLFGSDWPMITPEGWLEEFGDLPIKPENRQKILKDNAARLLGLKEKP